MKKLSIILISLLLMTALFVSCQVEVNEPQDKTVTLRFRTDDNSRTLTATRDSLDTSKYVWYYTAVKADETGSDADGYSNPTPASGTHRTEVKVGKNGKLTEEIADPLSLGKWKFTLAAYSDDKGQKSGVLIYKSEVTTCDIDENTDTIDITVTPQTGNNGILRVSKGINFEANGTTYTATNVTVTNMSDGTSCSTLGDSDSGYEADYETYRLTAGHSYKVTVSYEKDNITYATNTIIVNVWNGLTTTINGTLDEITVSPTFKAVEDEETGAISQATSITENTAATYEFDYSPASNEFSGSSNALGTTVKGTFKKTESTTGDAKLVVTTYDLFSATGSQTFTITGTGDSSTTEIPVAGVTCTLENAEFAEEEGGSKKLAIITTYIAKNFTDIKLYHVSGKTSTAMKSVGSEAAVDADNEYWYDSESGKLVFATDSFSSFFVSSTDQAMNVTTQKVYTDVKTAINEASTGDVVGLLNDIKVTLDDTSITISNKTVTLNLNGKTAEFEFTLSTSAYEKSGTAKKATIFDIGGTGESPEAATLNVTSGTLRTTNGSVFVVRNKSSLTLDNVTVEASAPFVPDLKVSPAIVYLTQGSNPVCATIKNSKLTNTNGWYGISTNAANSGTKANITVENSTVIVKGSKTITNSDEGYGTALLVNVPSDVKLTNSTFVGPTSGAIFRGGNYTVENCSFEATAEKTKHGETSVIDRYVNGYTDGSTYKDAWETGCCVPLAALVIGNRELGTTNNGVNKPRYPEGTTVVFSGTITLTVPRVFAGTELHVYQRNESEKVTVTGFNESWSVNADFNGATVKSSDSTIQYVSGLTCLTNAIATTSSNLKLVSDVGVETMSVTGTSTLDLNGYTVTLVEKTTKDSNNNTSYTGITNSGTLTLKNGTISYTGTTPDTASGKRYVIENSGTLSAEKLNIEAALTAECKISGGFAGIMSSANSCPVVAIVRNTGTATFDSSNLTLKAKLSGNSPINTTDNRFAGAKPIVIYQSYSGDTTNSASTTIRNNSTITVTSDVPGGVDGLYVVGSTATVSGSTIGATNSSIGWTRPVLVESSTDDKAEVTITNSTIASTDNVTQDAVDTVLGSSQLSASVNRVYGLKVRGNAVIKVDDSTMQNLKVTVKENGGTKIPYAGETYESETKAGAYGEIKDSNGTADITVTADDYASFATAIKYAPVNSTVKLDTKVSLTEDVTLARNLTLNMNGKTVESDGKHIKLSGSAVLTVKNAPSGVTYNNFITGTQETGTENDTIEFKASGD